MNQRNVTGTLAAILGNQQQPDGTQRKVMLDGPVFLHANGLRAENGIEEHYPDTDCALMQYAQEHYAFWRQRYPMLAARLATPGIFGENLSSLGLTEENVCPGDVFALGTVQIQVSWGAKPARPWRHDWRIRLPRKSCISNPVTAGFIAFCSLAKRSKAIALS